MAKPTVAAKLVETLIQAGVRRIHGVVGDSLNSIINEVRRKNGIEWIHYRHEEAAAFAAGSEAQLTGQLAICARSCGPGNLHLINGLYDAHRNMVPVLAIAAHIPSSKVGTDYFQETHPERLLNKIMNKVADEVVIPLDANYYGFAGDRGFLIPELTASATQHEAENLAGKEYSAYVSSNRMCEVGMTRATGKIYRSYIHLLEEATRLMDKSSAL